MNTSDTTRGFLQLKNDHNVGNWYQRAYRLGWRDLQDMRNGQLTAQYVVLADRRDIARQFVDAVNATRVSFTMPALLRQQA
jgi:hypothetical protein